MMYNTIQIKLFYEEWKLKLDSHLPGWQLVLSFIKSLIEENISISSWIFEMDGKRGYYVDIQKFPNNSKTLFLDYMKDYIWRDAIGIIRLQKTVDINKLLQNYENLSKGKIIDNEKSEVFPSLIDPGLWATINFEEVLLVIHHDGDSLFLLNSKLK